MRCFEAAAHAATNNTDLLFEIQTCLVREFEILLWRPQGVHDYILRTTYVLLIINSWQNAELFSSWPPESLVVLQIRTDETKLQA